MHGPMTRPIFSGFAQWHAKSLIAPVDDMSVVDRTDSALEEEDLQPSVVSAFTSQARAQAGIMP